MKKYANLDCIALGLAFRTSPYMKVRLTGIMQAAEEEERPAKPALRPVLSYSIQPVVQPVPVYSINTPVVVRVGPQVYTYKKLLQAASRKGQRKDPLSVGKLPILPVFSVYPVYYTHPVFHFPVGIYDHPYSPCFLSKNCGQHE